MNKQFKPPAFKVGDVVTILRDGKTATVNKVLPSFSESVYLLTDRQTGIGQGWFYKSEIKKGAAI